MATRKQAAEKTEQVTEQVMEQCPYNAGKAPEQVIPENVDKYLRLFSDYKKLYVDDQGSVYTEDTRLPVGKKIPLYTNPYYNINPQS